MHFDEKFFVALAFLLFVAVVYRPLGRMFGAGLDGRNEKIKKELEDAIALKEEAQTILAEAERKVKDLNEQAKEILAHANEEAERIKKEASEKMSREIKKRKQQFSDKAENLYNQAVFDVKAEAVENITEKVRLALADYVKDNAVAENFLEDSVNSIKRKFN